MDFLSGMYKDLYGFKGISIVFVGIYRNTCREVVGFLGFVKTYFAVPIPFKRKLA